MPAWRRPSSCHVWCNLRKSRTLAVTRCVKNKKLEHRVLGNWLQVGADTVRPILAPRHWLSVILIVLGEAHDYRRDRPRARGHGGPRSYAHARAHRHALARRARELAPSV